MAVHTSFARLTGHGVLIGAVCGMITLAKRMDRETISLKKNIERLQTPNSSLLAQQMN
jgi:hypothetical protein